MPRFEHPAPLMGRVGCTHWQQLDAPAEPRADRCEACGIVRVLRVCLECGHVGCCESRNGHAAEHARVSGHRLIRAWRGGAFIHCYDHGDL